MPSRSSTGFLPRCLLGLVAASALGGSTLAQAPADAPIKPLCPALPQAQEECPPDPPAPPQFGGPLLERPKLTGDWFGLRTSLQECGITTDVSSTQFYQGVASGGLQQSFPYGGRNDYFVNVDGEKLGLWKGFSLTLHGETRYGQSANFITGALSPVNEMLLVPASAGCVTALTGVKCTQSLSENILVFAGKINLFDEIRQPLSGAGPLDGFLNTSLIFNTILARTLPYSAFGAGFVWLWDKEPVFTLSVYDTNSTPTTSGFNSFFDNGATIFGIINLPTRFFGLPGHQGLDVTYSSGRYTNLTASPYLDPLGGLVFPSPPIAGSWAVGYHFDQALFAATDDPKRVWGVFGRLGVADSNPNPVSCYASAGISGASLLPARNKDTFGIGYYYLGISDTLKQSAHPNVPLRNEHGVELYYNARVTPWCQFTPDLQIIEPLQRQADTAFVVGVRAKLDF